MSDDKILDQVQPQAPAQPAQTPADSFNVGSLNKEVQPLTANPTEAIRLAGEEVKHEIAKEVADAGVRKVEDRPFLTDEHKQTGLDHSVPPPQTVPTGLISPIMTREEAVAQAKGDKRSAITWLGALLSKIFKGSGGKLVPEPV